MRRIKRDEFFSLFDSEAEVGVVLSFYRMNCKYSMDVIQEYYIKLVQRLQKEDGVRRTYAFLSRFFWDAYKDELTLNEYGLFDAIWKVYQHNLIKG